MSIISKILSPFIWLYRRIFWNWYVVSYLYSDKVDCMLVLSKDSGELLGVVMGIYSEFKVKPHTIVIIDEDNKEIRLDMGLATCGRLGYNDKFSLN